MATFRIGSKARVNLPWSFAHNCECTVIATDAIVMHGEDCFTGYRRGHRLPQAVRCTDVLGVGAGA